MSPKVVSLSPNKENKGFLLGKLMHIQIGRFFLTGRGGHIVEQTQLEVIYLHTSYVQRWCTGVPDGQKI
jgi:hypothetical protein